MRRWRDLRRQDEAKNAYSRFLFSIPGRGFTFVPQDTLFKLLHSVMREVTGDPTLRFHNLRHSFASRTYVMLAASAGGCAANVIATLPGYAQPLKLADELASNLFGHHQVTRRHVWAVCSLLGHSAPDISAEHYIHHLDIILAESLSCDPIAPTTHTVIEASRASQAQGYPPKRFAARRLGRTSFSQEISGSEGHCQPDASQSHSRLGAHREDVE